MRKRIETKAVANESSTTLVHCINACCVEPGLQIGNDVWCKTINGQADVNLQRLASIHVLHLPISMVCLWIPLTFLLVLNHIYDGTIWVAFPTTSLFVRDKERVPCWRTKLTSQDTTEDIGILQQTVLADGVFVAPASSQNMLGLCTCEYTAHLILAPH